jgi:ABC-type amino acid transport system permease subunit
MDMTVTVALLAGFAALFALASWRAARPTQFGKVRMVPWTAVSLVAALAAIVMLVHAVNLLGVQTGQARPGLPGR